MRDKLNIPRLLVCAVLFSAAVYAQPPDVSKKSLEDLIREYPRKDKAKCGERDEQLRLAKNIIEAYGNDERNREIIEYLRKDIAEIEREDPICRRNNRYNQAYKDKNWAEFFAVSKEIINDEGDAPLALDVMLTLVSVGFDRIVEDADNAYLDDTIFYAKDAIQMLERGKTPFQKSTKFGARATDLNYGVFLPFYSREAALKRMYFILGYICFHQLNAKQEAFTYFFKAVQYKGGELSDIEFYKILGGYYVNEAVRLNENTDLPEEAKANLRNGYLERAIDAYSRALRRTSANGYGKSDPLYEKIVGLYQLRFDLATTEAPNGLDRFIGKLRSQPLPDPLVQPTTLMEEPVEIRLKRKKSQ